MTDIILEGLRAAVVGLALMALLRTQRFGKLSVVDGWYMLIAGFALLFFGTLIDITDNFEALNRFWIVGDTPAQAFLEKVVGYLVGFVFIAVGIWKWMPRVAEHQQMMAESVQKAEEEVKVLRGLLPICSSCKKIRDDKGYWNQIEGYITEHSEAIFSHGICPECAEKLYPQEYKEMLATEASD